MTRLRLDPVRLSLLAALGVAPSTCSADRAIAADTGDDADDDGASATADGDEDGGEDSADGGDTGTPDLPVSNAPCDGATPILIDGAPSGYLRCPDGTVNRESDLGCASVNTEPACTGTEESFGCMVDADCNDGPNGRCVSRPIEGGLNDYCGCVYSCGGDDDCDAGQVCVCAGVVPTNFDTSTCAPAECSTNADCDSGECGVSSFDSGCGLAVALACREDSDACRLDTECGQGLSCSLGENGAFEWACTGPGCAVGRPLLVDGSARIAGTERGRSDWLDVDERLEVQLPTDPARRQQLAAYWAEVAALEHASVASFARFTLQLMALGAPAELVGDTQRAAADEVEHARLAFALASAYAGEALGPGPLRIDDVAITTQLDAVVEALVEEACVGETVGVAEALAAAEAALDPAVARVCHRIAADEQRHAELAWRTLQWLVRSFDVRAAALRAYERAVEALLEAEPSADALAHPGFSSESLAEIRVAALEQLVTPAMDACLYPPTTGLNS